MGVRKKTRTQGIVQPAQLSSPKSGGTARTNQPRSELLRQEIWQVVSMIPCGSVATYGQIAELIGYPRHARFVGTTLRNLPKGSRLPWYRVVSSTLRIPRRGGGETRQRGLLEAEDITFIGERIAMQHKWKLE